MIFIDYKLNTKNLFFIIQKRKFYAINCNLHHYFEGYLFYKVRKIKDIE